MVIRVIQSFKVEIFLLFRADSECFGKWNAEKCKFFSILISTWFSEYFNWDICSFSSLVTTETANILGNPTLTFCGWRHILCFFLVFPASIEFFGIGIVWVALRIAFLSVFLRKFMNWSLFSISEDFKWHWNYFQRDPSQGDRAYIRGSECTLFEIIIDSSTTIFWICRFFSCLPSAEKGRQKKLWWNWFESVFYHASIFIFRTPDICSFTLRRSCRK